MSLVTACLKVQVGDGPIELRSVFDDMYNFSMNAPDNVSVEQAVCFGLLVDNFIGFTPWFNIKPFSGMLIGPSNSFTTNSVGLIIDDETSSMGSGRLGDSISLSPHVTVAGFDDVNLKNALKNLSEVGMPWNWETLVDETPVSELQALMERELDANYIPVINYEPITLKIHRSTEWDIQSLFRGDHDYHTDMFDTVRFMLAGNEAQLDSRGFSQAYYDSQADVIVFKSNYSLTQTFDFNLGEPDQMT